MSADNCLCILQQFWHREDVYIEYIKMKIITIIIMFILINLDLYVILHSMFRLLFF